MFLLISKFNFFASLCWCGVAFSPQWIFHIRLAAQETSGNPLKDSPRKVPPKKLSTILTCVSPICVELFKLFRAWNWRSLWIHLVVLHKLLATSLTPGSWAGLCWPLFRGAHFWWEISGEIGGKIRQTGWKTFVMWQLWSLIFNRGADKKMGQTWEFAPTRGEGGRGITGASRWLLTLNLYS